MEDGLFFLRANYTRPVIYRFAMYRLDPVAPDGIAYLVATITEQEVRDTPIPDDLLQLIVKKLRAEIANDPRTAEPERAAESA